ncbi:phospholipid/cholesterol/gamma-HCH transport system substrate-binding protein [Nocardioides daedukensis]|uniref:Phospholipid/cholesterol/gamma-HCH transport system substrate-binding protein n=1 Tax=Nocardioides daedukensis TaxID=634462 RepID=A0A7Y9S5A4_9ACTN|nr:MCE family protein [Nocardioides daedukensis]NYG60024.1 phospholipid/cholesterol/gamma-HCH transport system substrate-binding protein [Nocardioides daedukensis]
MKRPYKVVDVFLGLASVALALALVAVALMTFNKAFDDTVEVSLETGAVGNALQKGSDVKLNGVPVGRVTAIDNTSTGARLTLALDPDTAEALPVETTARLLPKTLFGERYVVLVPPADGATSAGLEAGDSINQDGSAEAVELQELFDQLLPVLQSIEPGKLTAALGELAAMLRGQGTAIGDSITQWGAYLEKLNPLVPQMTEGIEKLALVANDFDAMAPDLLEALDTMSTTSATLVEEQDNFGDVFTNVITAADSTRGFVAKNQDTIIVLSEESRAALEAVRPYAGQFPCIFKAVRTFIPVMDRTLGKGSDEPGIHVRLNVVESRGKYLAGKDAPRYSTNGKTRCPYVTGQARRSAPGAGEPATIAPPASNLLDQRLTRTVVNGLGDANSPAENQLVAELMAPTLGMAPADFPEWGSLLVGPTLRNTKVELR